MHYVLKIEIDRPRSEVVPLFEDPEQRKAWQPGLQQAQLLEGTPGQEGAKTLLRYTMGKRPVQMTETITQRNRPHEFHSTYETRGVRNVQKNYFEELGDQRTLWTSDNLFRFESWSMKFMGWLMPKAFRKQSYQFMVLFKQLAERKIPANTKP